MPLTARSVHNHQLLPHIFHTSPQNIAKLQPPCATCMIMLFKCPIANKIQRSPFQNKPPLGTPASPPPLCEAAFSWDPSQMIHRCLPESTFSHASRKGGGFISSSTTFPTKWRNCIGFSVGNLLAFLGRIQEILHTNRHYLVFAGNLLCFGDRLGWSDRGWIGYDWIPYMQKPAKGNCRELSVVICDHPRAFQGLFGCLAIQGLIIALLELYNPCSNQTSNSKRTMSFGRPTFDW